MPRPDNVEPARVLGYLGGNDVLYCSRACAAKAGQPAAALVDQDQYDALVDRGSLAPAAVCPVCGSEYALDWRRDDER
jgi:hypothetical protein